MKSADSPRRRAPRKGDENVAAGGADPRPLARLPRDERETEVLAVASRLLTTVPFHRISFTMLAEESGISRAWMYSFFKDLGDVYLRIFNAAFDQLEFSALGAPEFSGDVATAWRPRAARHLEVFSPAASVIGSQALMFGARHGGWAEEVRRTILVRLQVCWIDPSCERGADRHAVEGGVLAYAHSLFGLVLALEHGGTTTAVAIEYLSRIAASVASLADPDGPELSSLPSRG